MSMSKGKDLDGIFRRSVDHCEGEPPKRELPGGIFTHRPHHGVPCDQFDRTIYFEFVCRSRILAHVPTNRRFQFFECCGKDAKASTVHSESPQSACVRLPMELASPCRNRLLQFDVRFPGSRLLLPQDRQLHPGCPVGSRQVKHVLPAEGQELFLAGPRHRAS